MTRHKAARLGAILFLISGALVIANNYAPATDKLDRPLLFVIGVSAIALGLVTGFSIPWERLPRRATLLLPLAGLSLVGLANAAGGVSEASYGVYFILIAAYIGATQPRWTTLAFTPIMSLVYVGALVYRGDASQESIWAVTVVIPLAVLVGEVQAQTLHAGAVTQRMSERRAELLAITARSARSVNLMDTRKVLAALADATATLGYEGVSLEVFDKDGSYRCLEARGLPQEFTGARHPADSGLTGEVLRERRQIMFDLYTSDPLAHEDLRSLGFKVVIGTPIMLRETVVAVLNAGTRRAIEVEPSELEALELMADQAGHALQVAGMFEREQRDTQRYRRESLIDDLTGLGNRRRAEQVIDTAVPGDVIGMIDLDDFKLLNDTRGHFVGDSVLSSLGALLRNGLRDGDIAARYGGEEFLLVIRGPNPSTDETAERIRRSWLAADQGVTLSVGTAILGDDETPREALGRADRALFAAKAAGKNCVRRATDAEVIDINERRSPA